RACARRALVVGERRGQEGMRVACVHDHLREENRDGGSVTILSHLDELESEAIHILREVVAEARSPALLFSGGKDSIVMLRLAEKAFRPDRFPFPLLHIDTE